MFKSYEMKKFGEYLRRHRKSLGITQKEVSEISSISSETLRKLESGRVIPKYETIIILSRAYRTDLMKVFMAYSTENELLKFYSYVDDVVFGFDEEKLQNLANEFAIKFNETCIEGLIHTFEMNQMKYMVQGIQDYYSNKKPSYGYESFMNAIKLSFPGFDTKNLDDKYYTQLEIRLLILLSLSLEKMQRFKEAERLLLIAYQQKINNCIDYNDRLIMVKLYFNLSYVYHNIDNYELALKYSNEGIQFCIENHLNFLLPSLYYRFGIAKFLLNRKDFMADLSHSVNLLRALRKDTLANLYKKIALEKYNIEIRLT